MEINIVDLPLDILREIFHWLTVGYSTNCSHILLQCRLVCRLFRAIASHDNLWSLLYTRKFAHQPEVDSPVIWSFYNSLYLDLARKGYPYYGFRSAKPSWKSRFCASWATLRDEELCESEYSSPGTPGESTVGEDDSCEEDSILMNSAE